MIYRARGAAADLFRSQDDEVLIEGPAGTGKTRAALEKINWYCDAHPGVRVLICRDTRVSLTESVLVTLENKVFWPSHPCLDGSCGRSNRHSYLYPNKSEIIVGGLDNPDRIMSTEYDLVYVAEATEVSVEAWEKLLTRLRNNVGPYQQAIADCNPGPSGHWLNLRAERGQMRRLLSRHKDNPSLTPEYLERLSQLSGHRRSRLFEGIWCSAEGLVYVEFDPKIHVIKPFPGGIPADWPRWRGIDYGSSAPTACLWLTIGDNERLYVYREHYDAGHTIDRNAAMIIASSQGETYRNTYIDPHSIDSPPAVYGMAPTVADQYKKAGIKCSGWPYMQHHEHAFVARVRKRLEMGEIRVFANCVNLIREFQSWSYVCDAEGNPTAKDRYEEANNHALDVLKGIVATNPTFTQPTIQVCQ